MLVLLPIGLRNVADRNSGVVLRGIVVDDEERDGGKVVSIIGDEASSVPAVFRIFGVPPRPSLGTTVGGVRASEALISYRVGGWLQRLCIGGWGRSAVEVATRRRLNASGRSCRSNSIRLQILVPSAP
jgi:hypothetical protein